MMMMETIRDCCTLRAYQARRLFTHEDGRFFHVHKMLGTAVLLHFAYRLTNWFRYGDTGLDGEYYDNRDKWTLLFFYALHAVLHVTSFQFRVPDRRNPRYNIIWPEMRWHTMIFAYRSLAVLLLHWCMRNLCAISAVTSGFETIDTVTLLDGEFRVSSVGAFRKASILVRGSFVFMTMFLADIVTVYYRKKVARQRAVYAYENMRQQEQVHTERGNIESEEGASRRTSLVQEVTTDTSRATSMTMRNNPYPPYASPAFVKVHNLFYSTSQVLATMNIMFTPDVDKVFMTLLPIQTAPFGMTLQKKGVITQAGWHVFYTLALLSNYMLACSPRKLPPPSLGEETVAYDPVSRLFGVRFTRTTYLSLVALFVVCRFKLRCNKYVLWALVLAFVTACA